MKMTMAALMLACISVLGMCGETSAPCPPCADDYKTKSMPPKRGPFCPTGCDTFQMKSGVPIRAAFNPTGCDDYKFKSLPCFKANTLGKCFPDQGAGINFWGLRPRPDSKHPSN